MKMTTTDSELLQQFARDRSEKAFATLVSRHVDLVYSAALRQVRSSQLAEEVAQTVFLDLSRSADKLKSDTILTAWLYTVTRRKAIDVVRHESSRQLREQIAVELAAMKTPDAHWKEIEPLLDEAMETLDETDRSAILLRYFENKSLREVGKTLGTSDDAAQKRVSRAVERLREYFSKNGIAVGSGGFVALLSGNAVQAAPIALSAMISSAAIAGGTVSAAALIGAGKTLIMTTTQKVLVTTALAAALGTGVYELAQNSRLKSDLQRMEQKLKPLTEQNEQFRRDRDEAVRQLAGLNDDNERLNRNASELLKLRDEVARLRTTSGAVSTPTDNVLGVSDPDWRDWMKFRPLDLAQFPDSETEIKRASAIDVGTATPAALLQTWIWAQRINDASAILKTWDFPEGTPEEKKMERVAEALRDGEYSQQNPGRFSHPEQSRLRDLFTLGDDYFLAFIENGSPGTKADVSHQIFRRVGDEWKVCVGKPRR